MNVNLPRTSEALADLEANDAINFGPQIEPVFRTGAPGLIVGSVPFDPIKHHPTAINPLSPFSAATGQDYVSEVMPFKAIHLWVLADETRRAELEMITNAKREIAPAIIQGLSDAISYGIGNRTSLVVVGPKDKSRADADVFYDSHDREQAYDLASDITLGGLRFVLSDFEGKTFAPGSLEGVIAIKVNHYLERSVPEGKGPVEVGVGHTLNSKKSKEVNGFNDELEKKHQKTVAELKTAGAMVVSVCSKHETDPVVSFDEAETDRALAQAVKEANR